MKKQRLPTARETGGIKWGSKTPGARKETSSLEQGEGDGTERSRRKGGLHGRTRGKKERSIKACLKNILKGKGQGPLVFKEV